VSERRTGYPVVYWKWRTHEDLRRLEEQTGKGQLPPCHPFVSAVLNLDQVDAVPRPADDVAIRDNQRVEAAERLIAEMSHRHELEIVHGASREPSEAFPSISRNSSPVGVASPFFARTMPAENATVALETRHYPPGGQARRPHSPLLQ